eukprot:snap_masked-scaffold_18-processed-gene-1.43-mRNA-1 protein AED:0.15 eAED:0.15 QI:87/0.88/0.9/1/0.33/0.3/10/56/351
MTEQRIRFSAKVYPNEIKVILSALICCSKISQEVAFEAVEKTGETYMRIKANNEQKTAFLLFHLSLDFFDSFEIKKIQRSNNKKQENVGNEKKFTAKVDIKHCLSAFKSFKSMKEMKIKLVNQGINHFLCFESICESQIKKIHKIGVEDDELPEPVAHSNKKSKKVVGSPSLFLNLLQHLHLAEELKIKVLPGLGILLSTLNSFSTRKNMINTNLKLDKDELDLFDVTVNGDETQASDTREEVFCEGSMSKRMGLFFHECGDPLLLSTKEELVYEDGEEEVFYGELILATFGNPVEELPPENELEEKRVEKVQEKSKPTLGKLFDENMFRLTNVSVDETFCPDPINKKQKK